MSKLKSLRHRLKAEKKRKRERRERRQNSITGITVSVFISEIKLKATLTVLMDFFFSRPFS